MCCIIEFKCSLDPIWGPMSQERSLSLGPPLSVFRVFLPAQTQGGKPGPPGASRQLESACVVHQSTLNQGVVLWHSQSDDGKIEDPVTWVSGHLRTVCQGIVGEITSELRYNEISR